MDEISIASAFLSGLARLLLMGLIAWGVILLCPLEAWAKQVAVLLLAGVIVFALIADLTRRAVPDVSVPRNVPPITR